MIQGFSDKIKGWFAVAIVVLIAISFVVWGISYYLKSTSGDQAVIAKIGSVSITKRQLDQQVRQSLVQVEQQQGALNPDQRKQFRDYVLQQLISTASVRQGMDKLGLGAPKAEIEGAIQSQQAFQQNGQFSSDLLKNYLARSGQSLKQVMNLFASELVQKQLEAGVLLSSFALPREILAYYNWEMQTRDFSSLTVAVAKIKKGINVSAKDINEFYKNHLGEYKLPEMVSISYLILDPNVMVKSVQLTAAEIKQYYAANQSQFRDPATYKFARIVLPDVASTDAAASKKLAGEKAKISSLLQSGKTVAQIAKQFGGVTESLTEDKLSDMLRQKLATMGIGEELKGIAVPGATVWLQLLAVDAGKVKPLSAVSTKIKNLLKTQRIQKKLAAMTEKLSNLTYMQSDTLQPAAKALGLSVLKTPLLSKAGAKQGLFADKKLLVAAFSQDVLDAGNNSDPISLKNGSIVVLRVNKRVAAQEQPLSDVKGRVVTELKQQMAEAKAALLASEIMQKLRANQSVATLLSKNNLQWVNYTGIKRDDKKVPATILAEAFRLSDKASAAHYAVDALPDGSSAVVSLKAIHLPAQSDLTAAKRDKIKNTVRGTYAKVSLQFLIKSLSASVKQKLYLQRLAKTEQQ